MNIHLRIFPLLMGLAVSAAFLPSTARAQATVGIWDLTPWVFTGTSISAPTIDSTGPKVAGLSATSQSSSSVIFVGKYDGAVSTTSSFTLPAGAPLVETLEQTFLLDKPVNFGPLHTQSQFNEFAGNNNGVGVAVTLGNIDLLVSYSLTLTLTGGGTFKSVEGTFVDEPVITAMDNQTVTLMWTTFTSPTIVLDKVTVAGAITSFQASHTWEYLNGSVVVVDSANAVEMIVSNAPPEPPVVKVSGKKNITTKKSRARLRGVCDDYNGDIRYVEVKTGKRGYRKARGTANWRFAVRGLKPGRNKVLIRAVDSMGATSRPDRVTITRKS